MNNTPNPASELLEKIMQTAKAVMPESISNDVKSNLRAAIQDVISELDVVTREELDIQKAVLKKTRTKVDEMEVIVAELEQRLDNK